MWQRVTVSAYIDDVKLVHLSELAHRGVSRIVRHCDSDIFHVLASEEIHDVYLLCLAVERVERVRLQSAGQRSVGWLASQSSDAALHTAGALFVLFV